MIDLIPLFVLPDFFIGNGFIFGEMLFDGSFNILIPFFLFD